LKQSQNISVFGPYQRSSEQKLDLPITQRFSSSTVVNSQSQNKDLQSVKVGFYTTQIFSNFSVHFQKRSGPTMSPIPCYSRDYLSDSTGELITIDQILYTLSVFAFILQF